MRERDEREFEFDDRSDWPDDRLLTLCGRLQDGASDDDEKDPSKKLKKKVESVLRSSIVCLATYVPM